MNRHFRSRRALGIAVATSLALAAAGCGRADDAGRGGDTAEGAPSPGITDDIKDGAALTVSIAQFGSTRSINAGVAAGIAMHTWITQHSDMSRAW